MSLKLYEESHKYSVQKAEYVKQEPNYQYTDEVNSFQPSVAVKNEPPQAMEQLQLHLTSRDQVGDGEVILKTEYVKEESESECDERVCEYRVALLADLSKKIKDELDLDVTAAASATSASAGERSLQQIIDGCFVKLERLNHHSSTSMKPKKQSRLKAHTCNEKDAFKSKAQPKRNNTKNKENNCVNLKYRCQYCHEEFTSKRKMVRHKINHSRSNVTCDICKRNFTNKYRLEKHICKHLKGKSKQSELSKTFACDLCTKVFNYGSKLRLHQHGCAFWFTCRVCKKRFKNESDLIDHKTSHTDQKTFPCGLCDKEFDDCPSLLKHKQYHRKRFYICDVCQRKFNQRRFLIEHLWVHTDKYVCGLCEEMFTDKSKFEDHKLCHQKKLHCEICEKVYRTELALKNHMIVHTGPKPFTCEICDKTFRLKHYLSVHKRYHTDKKPHVCEICKKAFETLLALTKHKKYHMANKPYTCEYCKKGYAQKSDLNVHIRTHTGEKPFVCDVCGRPFRYNSNLHAHKKIIHKNT